MLLPDIDDESVLVVRTDYTDVQGWHRAIGAISTPFTGFQDDESYEASLSVAERPDLAGLAADQVMELLPVGFFERHAFFVIVDAVTVGSPEAPVLLVNGWARRDGEAVGDTFRAVGTEVSAIDANLSLVNMEFSDWALAADADGIFRSFGSD